MEFDVREGARIAGRRLMDVTFPEGSIVGAILRDEQVITPRGRHEIEVGDRVVIFALPDAIGDIERLFS
ncbi:MAG: TrkA C-terminal domain-containing protein [Longimicrobiales bacterium]